jgi:8-oxo-dGTP diphosphatase
MASDFWLNAAASVDLVVLTIDDGRLCGLLVRRGIDPFIGEWALPGGFVHADEDLPDAAYRELLEETGVRRDEVHLEQLATYGRPDRDPRGRVISTAYLALTPQTPVPVAGSDAAIAALHPVEELLDGTTALAFDHGQILVDGVERARSKLEYTPLATTFCEPEFTVAELRRVYETVWGHPLDPRNFHRKVTGAPDFVRPTGSMTGRDGGRPAALFTVGSATALHPPLLRPS